MDKNTNLAHYGVKGMKWGVRRTPAQLRASRKERKASKAEAKKKAKQEKADAGKSAARKKLEKVDLDNIGDKELRQIVNRAKLEQEFSQVLSGPAKQKSNIGKKFEEQLSQKVVNETLKTVSPAAIALGAKVLAGVGTTAYIAKRVYSG